MQNFKIKIISLRPKKVDGLLSHINQISIGDYKESTYMPITDWSINDYEQQWKDAIERIKTHDQSCLVVSVSGLKTKNPCVWTWPMYKVGNKIFFQNQLLNNESVKESGFSAKLSDFNLQNCYQFIDNRTTNDKNEGIGDDGEKLFEKSITIDELI